MFQNISQGATLYVLYRNEPRVADGRVVSVNTHMPTYNPNQPMSILNGLVTDISVQINNDTIPFVGLPASGVVANFPDKGIFIATDKSSILRELETMMTASKQVLEQIPAHQKMIKECDRLLVELQPERRKEAQQEKEIENLKTQLTTMSDKFDKVVELLSVKFGNMDKAKE